MVNAVVRRRVHHPLERPHAANQLGVNPVLVEEADTLLKQHSLDGEANQQERHPEDPASEWGRPRLPQCRGEVVVLRRVVVHMAGPEEAHLVARPVVPVVAKILGQDERGPGPPAAAQVVDCEGGDPGVERHGEEGGGGGDDEVAGAHGEARRRVDDRVAARAPTLPQQLPLAQHREHEEGDGVEDDRVHGAAPGCGGAAVLSHAAREGNRTARAIRLAVAKRLR